MALAIGTKTYSNLNPGGVTQTLSHNQNAGADGYLMVAITMASTVNFSGCKYNNVSMTLISNTLFSGLSTRQAVYGLLVPSTGSNNIVVSFSGAQWNSTSISAISFTGSAGPGNNAVNGASDTPHSQSLTISENSVIYATGISQNSQSFGYDIAGSTRTNLFYHNVNKVCEAALSATGLSAGSTNVTTKADFGTITNNRFEIKEASGVTPSNRRVFLVT